MKSAMEIAAKELEELIAAAKSPMSAIDALKAETVTQVYNVKTGFGAKGDGITDDTLAIQNAIDAANITSGDVYFPAGVYAFSGIEMKSNVSLVGKASLLFIGDEWSAMIKATSQENIAIKDLVLDQNAVDGKLFDLNNCTNVSLSDVSLRNGTNTEGSNPDGSVFFECENVTLNNVSVDSYDTRNIIRFHTSSNVVVKSISGDNVKGRVLSFLLCSNVVVDGAYFSKMYGIGDIPGQNYGGEVFYFNESQDFVFENVNIAIIANSGQVLKLSRGCESWSVNNVHVHKMISPSGAGFFRVEGGENGVVDGLNIYSLDGVGGSEYFIWILPHSETNKPLKNIIIRNCYFKGDCRGISVSGHAILESDDITLLNNTLYTSQESIRYSGENMGSLNVVGGYYSANTRVMKGASANVSTIPRKCMLLDVNFVMRGADNRAIDLLGDPALSGGDITLIVKGCLLSAEHSTSRAFFVHGDIDKFVFIGNTHTPASNTINLDESNTVVNENNVGY